MAQKVTAPKRQARTGGIKAIVGAFVNEPRLGINDAFVWEDSECGFPSTSRAGCLDSVIPLTFDDVVVTDNGDTFTFSRTGNSVHVQVTFGAGTPTGFTAPWNPLIAVNEAVTGGTVVITTAGAGSQTGTPTGVTQFNYTTSGDALGYYFDDVGEGPEQHEFIGPVFARYTSIGCFIGGDNDEAGKYQDQAKRLLEATEDREVEAVLWDWAVAAATPGTAASVEDAIAAAEEYADANYVYRPVLVMSRGNAQIAFDSGALKRDGDLLYTGNGTPVLSTGAVPSNGQAKVVIIGQPAVYASEIVVGTGLQKTLNRELAVAQRLYGLGVDCDFRYAVSVTAP